MANDNDGEAATVRERQQGNNRAVRGSQCIDAEQEKAGKGYLWFGLLRPPTAETIRMDPHDLDRTRC